MHDDEYREEQKAELLKLTCWLFVAFMGVGLWVLAYKGFYCWLYHTS